MLPGPARLLLLAPLLMVPLLRAPVGQGSLSAPPLLVRGVTISCQTWGREWGTDAFADELDELARLGANWVAIHPYARVHADGSLSWRPVDPEDPPAWLARPIAEAHARGMAILVKPHLAYWGSPFSWRGEIEFAEGEERERFFADYRAWITAVAGATRGADAFAVGTELDRTLDDEAAWRAVIEEVRGATDARLTYAANWTDVDRVPFWDALDAVGVQAYYPLAEEGEPDDEELRAGWEGVLAGLRSLHERTGKPVVFTELGYPLSTAAAREPWSHHEVRVGEERELAAALQERCLRVGLAVLHEEREWLRGAFLWKWFPGEAPGANFLLDRPGLRAVMRDAWR
jgi:hypothetical protein